MGGADNTHMLGTWVPSDGQVRAMVALVETQAAQLAALREAVDGLQSRCALRAELDGLLLHDLRAPLEAMAAALLAEPDAAAVTAAGEAATRLARTAGELLGVQPGEFPIARGYVEHLSLVEVADRLVAALPADVADRLDLSVEQGSSVNTSPSRIVALLVDLVEHAAAVSTPAATVPLRLWIGDGELVAEIDDDDPEGRHGAGPDDRADPGLGLFLARRLARSLGGDVAVVRRIDRRGSVVRVVLPQRRADDVHQTAVS